MTARTPLRTIPYVPPRPLYDDMILAFKAMQDSGSMYVTIERDPLGPVNCIVTLWRRGCEPYRCKSVLYPVNARSVVQLGRDTGTPKITLWGSDWGNVGEISAYRPPCWYVEINGRRVIDVPDSETRPPAPPAPHVPWHRRTRIAAQTAVRRRCRALADRVAARAGYVPEDSIGGDW